MILLLQSNEGGEGSSPATEASKPAQTAAVPPPSGVLFQPHDYAFYVLGVVVLGGLIAIPLIWGSWAGLSYTAAVPWGIGSSVVFLVGINRDGSLAPMRMIIAIVVATFAINEYSKTTGQASFAAGGLIGVAVMGASGFLGVIVGRFVRSLRGN